MKRHFFMEDALSFHICLCLHFKVSVTGCLGLKRKGRRAERRSKEGVVVGVCWLQGPEGQYMQPKCRLAWKYSTVSLNTVIELDVFMHMREIHFSQHKWIRQRAQGGKKVSSLTLKSLSGERVCGEWTSSTCEGVSSLKLLLIYHDRKIHLSVYL